MLGLQLRDEFQSDHMRDTAISFHRDDGSGALDIGVQSFFDITYPSVDLQKALEAVSQRVTGRPIVLLGERGRGKSHIMAALHYALAKPDEVEAWAHDWGDQLGEQRLRDLRLRRGYYPITESIHHNEFVTLWDVLFKYHPQGERFRGRFEEARTPVPGRALLEAMFAASPSALILDEFQSWFDGQVDEPGPTGAKYYAWTFNFLQLLSELAAERPDLLLLIVSVRNNNTNAYGQIHRNHPFLVDFKESIAREDRQRLVLHRLFSNRRHIQVDAIQVATTAYRSERFRLVRGRVDAGSLSESDQEVVDAWPFSPELFELLEDQILFSEQAQGLRDLIRVLAHLYRAQGDHQPLLTPADFAVDEDSSGVQSLIDAIASVGQERLREKACRNLEAVQDANIEAPHARGLISAIWMRSFSPGHAAGASARQLHLDLTHATALDDNLFADELEQVVANSFNIHREGDGRDARYVLKEEENPRSRLLASARNDKLFENRADRVYIRRTLRMLLSPATIESVARVIVLGPDWNYAPWENAEDADRPENWERPALIVLPELPRDLSITLGPWLKTFVPQNRNTVRFLLPRAGATALYEDREVLVNARAAVLAELWRGQYTQVGSEFTKKLRDLLESRYDRYAILRNWNFPSPSACTFTVESHGKKGAEIPSGIDKSIKDNVFQPEDFERLVLRVAAATGKVGLLIRELREPPPDPNEDAIPFLGEKEISEQLLHLAAQGKIALNVNGTWVARRPEHATDEEAMRALRPIGFRQGRELAEIGLALPSAVGTGAVAPVLPGPPSLPPMFPINTGLPSNGQGNAAPATVFGVAIGRTSVDSLPQTGVETVPPLLRAGENPPETQNTSTRFPPPQAATKRTRRSEPKTPLNLSGQLEAWGLASNETIPLARIEIGEISVSELKQLLLKLPMNLRVILEVALREGQEE